MLASSIIKVNSTTRVETGVDVPSTSPVHAPTVMFLDGLVRVRMRISKV